MMKPEITVTPEPAERKIQVSDQTYDYYKRVYGTFKDIDVTDDQDIFFTNVFRQLQTEALVVCQHKVLSFNIEAMLKLAQPKHIYMLWKAFIPDWMAACTDTYAGHVFHSLVLCFPVTFDLDVDTLLVKDEGSVNDESKMEESGEKMNVTDTEQSKKGDPETCPRKMFLEFCSFIKEHLDELITDTYATHIVRAALQVLANIPVDNNITVVYNKKTEYNKVKLHESKPDETFHKQLSNISKLIIKSPNFIRIEQFFSALEIKNKGNIQNSSCLDLFIQAFDLHKSSSGYRGYLVDRPVRFEDYISHKGANPVIQLILKLTFQLKQKKGERLSKKMIRLCDFFDVPPVDPDTPLTDNSRLPNLMTDVYVTYFVQVLLEHCSEDLFLTWYESSFQNRLIAYAVHEQSNYVLQHVIDRCSNKEMFSLVFDEISPYIEDMLSMKHIGVVKCLLQRCLALGIKQKKIVKKLLDAFHCAEEDNNIMIVPLLLAMKTHEVYMENITLDEGEKTENPEKFAKIIISIHGSMIVQTLFNFGNPKLFVDSFLHLTPKQMISVMCQFYGTFLIKDFFNSSTIGEKSKDAILQKSSGSYSDIACCKVGSRLWQEIWSYLSINQKTIVAEELCKNALKMKRNTYGFYVYNHLALGTFQHDRQQWQISQAALSNKRKMFDDILDPTEVGKKSKKSKSSSENKVNKQICLDNNEQPDENIIS